MDARGGSEPVEAAVGSASGRASRIPPFILELGDDPRALRTLVIASLAVAAAGLDPKALSPGMSSAQQALHQRPELESLFLLGVMVATAFTILGGLLGDILRRRGLLLVGLLLMIVAEAGSAFFGTGPGFVASRFLAAAATGLILPVALAMIAVSYTGAARATALGIAYAGLGATSAAAPAILGATTPTMGGWPAFVVAAIAAAFCLWLVRRSLEDVPVPGLGLRDVAGHGMWAMGLLAVTGGITGIRSDPTSPIRLSLIVAGVLLIVAFLLWQRHRRHVPGDAAIDVRPVTVALMAGVVIAVAQTAPSMQAPIFFQVVSGMSSLMATVAIAPFVLALLVSGPVAGLLLNRMEPRTLIVGGLAVVGIGDILFGLAGPHTFYPYFIIPLAAVGAGFVVGTCVRTAVIFASVPRRLPSTAAALNQSSLMLGGQIGVAAVTAIVSEAAISSFQGSPAATGSGGSTAIDGFRSFLEAVGTSSMGTTISGLSDSLKAGYGAAYAAGVSQALTSVGVAALIAAVICWLAMGKQAPLTSVWEHRDERPGPESAPASLPGLATAE